ncbi:hypothetical protein DMENIID0001_043240 [Sergentomyia squamirostris]
MEAKLRVLVEQSSDKDPWLLKIIPEQLLYEEFSLNSDKVNLKTANIIRYCISFVGQGEGILSGVFKSAKDRVRQRIKYKQPKNSGGDDQAKKRKRRGPPPPPPPPAAAAAAT